MYFPCPNLRWVLGTESDSPFRSSGIPFSFYLQVRILNARFLTAAYLGVIKNLRKAGTGIEQKVKPRSYSTTDHRGECRIQPTTMSSREGSICYYFALYPPPAAAPKEISLELQPGHGDQDFSLLVWKKQAWFSSC